MLSITSSTYKSFGFEGESINMFGEFADQVLGWCNEAFSVMYRRIFKEYWHDNRFYAKMSQNYCATNWDGGAYEVYIPIAEHPTQNMTYYRIVVKVVPEVDPWIARGVAAQMVKPVGVFPMGVLDSELVVVVAPKRKGRGFVRGFRHEKKKGYLTAVVINKSPEIVFKRLLSLVRKFVEERIDRLLAKLDFKPWQYDYKDKKQFYYNIIINIIERFSYSIATTVKCLSRVLDWLNTVYRRVLNEIGRQNMVKKAIRAFSELKESLTAVKELSTKTEAKNPPFIEKLIEVLPLVGYPPATAKKPVKH